MYPSLVLKFKNYFWVTDYEEQGWDNVWVGWYAESMW